MSIKLYRQSVISHHAFDQRSQWRATALDCSIRHSRRESFLAHLSMTSEQGGRNSDTFFIFILKDVYGNYYLFVFLFIFLFCYYYY